MNKIFIAITLMLVSTPVLAFSDGEWKNEWYTCQTNDDCTFVNHPCRYIAVNKQHKTDAEEAVAKEAPFIDCEKEDLILKATSPITPQMCNEDEQCVFVLKSQNKQAVKGVLNDKTK